jgi:hypothetical protein
MLIVLASINTIGEIQVSYYPHLSRLRNRGVFKKLTEKTILIKRNKGNYDINKYV